MVEWLLSTSYLEPNLFSLFVLFLGSVVAYQLLVAQVGDSL